MPISNFLEIEYNELLQMRFDLVDRMGRTADDMELNKEVWIRYVLEKIAKLPKDLVDNLLKREQMEKVDLEKDKDTAAALTENRNLLEKVSVVEESMTHCRVHAMPCDFLNESKMDNLKEKAAASELPSEEVLKHLEEGNDGTIRNKQEERAKARLETLEAMASAFG
jgi:hypothetical protein